MQTSVRPGKACVAIAPSVKTVVRCAVLAKETFGKTTSAAFGWEACDLDLMAMEVISHCFGS